MTHPPIPPAVAEWLAERYLAEQKAAATRTVVVETRVGGLFEVDAAAGWEHDPDSQILTVYGVDHRPLRQFRDWTSVGVKAVTR